MYDAPQHIDQLRVSEFAENRIDTGVGSELTAARVPDFPRLDQRQTGRNVYSIVLKRYLTAPADSWEQHGGQENGGKQK